jgi:hypothetical protein
MKIEEIQLCSQAVTTSLDTRTKNLGDEFDGGIQETLIDMQTIKTLVQPTWRVLETRLEVETRAEHGHSGSTGTGVCTVKRPKFDESSLVVFRRHFEPVAQYNNWAPR